ncbi:MAG: hypothetical protein IPK58_06980 [Acidobacteria bacterium]|nr:hypothetical protein [Acidobacteriota bacterium]
MNFKKTILFAFLFWFWLRDRPLHKKVNAEMLVTTGWLAKNLDRTVLLHVGTDRKSYDAGHIPAARFLSWGDITITREGVPNEIASVENLEKAFSAAGVGNKEDRPLR